MLYTRGRAFAIDPGMTLYGAPVNQSWYRTTLAHNTLVVNEQSQSAVTGKSLAFGQTAGVDYAMVDAGPIYSGVRWVRSVALLDPQHLIFIDQVYSGNEATVDLAYHQIGNFTNLPAGAPFKPSDANGYRHLSDATQRPLTDVAELTWKQDESWSTKLVILADGPSTKSPTTVITANGIGSQPQQKVPMTLLRRTAKQSVFAWGLSLDATPLHLEDVSNAIDPTSRIARQFPPFGLKVTRQNQSPLILLANPENLRCRLKISDVVDFTSEASFHIQRDDQNEK